MIDADGFVRITDRMKDIIITAGGKNVTPSEIENQLKFSPYISDAVVIGDQRKFLSCLVMIDHETVAQFAQERNVPFTNFASLCRAKEVQDLIWGEIERVNKQLARVETIKKFRLIEQILTPEDEELTPTMKLKRTLRQPQVQGRHRRHVRRRVSRRDRPRKERAMRRRLAIGLVVLMVVALAGMAMAQTRGVSTTEIVLGMHTDLSGPAATYGVSSSNAVKMRFDEVNEKGGIHGRKIKLIVEDTQYQVPRAVQAGTKLINRDHIFAMVAPLGTPMNNALFKDQFEAGVPNLFPLSAARSMYEPFHKLKFYGAASYVDQVRAGIKYFVTKKGKKALCAMYQDTDFGKEVLDGVQMQADKLKIKIVETVTHKPTDQDFTAQITKLKGAGCDLVVLGTIVRDSIVPYATARKIGWTDVDFLGSAATLRPVRGGRPGRRDRGALRHGPHRHALPRHAEPDGAGVVRSLQGPVQGRSEHRRGLRPRGRRPHGDRARQGGQGPHHRQLREGAGVDQGLPRHLQRPRGHLRPRQAPGRELLVPRRGQGRALGPRDRAAVALSSETPRGARRAASPAVRAALSCRHDSNALTGGLSVCACLISPPTTRAASTRPTVAAGRLPPARARFVRRTRRLSGVHSP